MNIFIVQKLVFLNLNICKYIFYIFFLILVVNLVACSSTPDSPPLAADKFACNKDLHIEYPLQQLEKTAKQSEFLPIHKNKDAYQWRLAFVDQAKKSLDIQREITLSSLSEFKFCGSCR